MATEASTTQATTETTEKVTFTPEQQEKIQEIINSRMGAAGKAAKEEAAAAKAEAEALKQKLAELEKVSAKPSKGERQSDIEALQAKIAEMESVGKNAHSEIERLNKMLADKDKIVQEAKVEALSVKKQSAIQAAASKHQFVDVGVVTKLTSDSVMWDEARNRWTVVNEAGQERMNASYEPMTLEEYYAEFASKNPYLVQSTFRGGTGSAESQRSTLGTASYNVEDVFGPKSNSILANKIKLENPKLYASMKASAREKGLVR